MTTDQGPIACDLTRLPPGAGARLLADLRALLARVDEIRPLADGYALRLPPPAELGLIAKLGEIIDHDRLCCPFVGHAVVSEPHGGPVWFHLTGPDPVPAFIAQELDALLPEAAAARAGLRRTE